MFAAWSGHIQLMKLFIDEVGMTDIYGATALMKAASNDHAECVKLLNAICAAAN